MFTMREDDAGTCHGRFRIPTLHGQWLRKMLLALCSPVRSTAAQRPTSTRPCPPKSRHGHAFCQLIEAIPAKSLPKAGGCGATIVVTMRLDQLLTDLHTADPHRRRLRPRHRRTHHRRRSPTPRLHRRHHPRRPRRQVRSPRPRPGTTRLLTPPTHRHGHPRQRLHRRRLRPPSLHVPRPPRHTLVPRRPHRPQPPADSSAATTTDASTTPPTPRAPPQRQSHLPPAHVRRGGRGPMSPASYDGRYP